MRFLHTRDDQDSRESFFGGMGCFPAQGDVGKGSLFKEKLLKIRQITFLISSYLSTINEQRVLLLSNTILPIPKLVLIVLRTSTSSICKDILKRNFT